MYTQTEKQRSTESYYLSQKTRAAFRFANEGLPHAKDAEAAKGRNLSNQRSDLT
jgi:hypothetical protein